MSMEQSNISLIVSAKDDAKKRERKKGRAQRLKQVDSQQKESQVAARAGVKEVVVKIT